MWCLHISTKQTISLFIHSFVHSFTHSLIHSFRCFKKWRMVKGKRQLSLSQEFTHSSYVASSLKEDAAILGKNAGSCTSEMTPKLLKRWSVGQQDSQTSHIQTHWLIEGMWSTGLLPHIASGLRQLLVAACVAILCQATAPWRTDAASGIHPSCP